MGIDWTGARAGSLSLTDSLAVAIERQIVAGRLGHGDRLPAERELAAQLGVSRGSLREALDQLERRGVIDRRRGRGTSVVDRTRTDSADQLATAFTDEPVGALEALEVRACLEPSIAARAARRATAADVALLEAALRETERAEGPEEFMERDRTFHRTIAHITHNPLLVRMVDRTRDVLDLSRRGQELGPASRAVANEEHRAIFRAVADRDPVAAAAAAEAHLEGIRAELEGEVDPPH
ncbi:FadR/GntR family transcriptional regulator [Kineococcus sp. NPDC059986]|uniref:FadR/GntR family transcriptional regulator n=1 Tax=Kineococcus sp. NPDC059986 TaxID=3155538 RepID=UPI00344BA333